MTDKLAHGAQRSFSQCTMLAIYHQLGVSWLLVRNKLDILFSRKSQVLYQKLQKVNEKKEE